jgi:nitrogen fixation/metabolism regulation signal transduction histidine kinase
MKLRFQYLLFVGLLHLLAVVLSFFVLESQPFLFLASELVIFLSLYVFYRLYRRLVRPIEVISQGVNAIADQDFHVKFQSVGQQEVDELIGVYNQMIDQLREERTQQARQHFFLEKLIQTSPTGILILNLEGEIHSCNPKAEQLLGWKAAELKGKKPEAIAQPLLQAIAALPNDSTKRVQVNGIRTFKCHKAHFIDRGFANYFVMIEDLTTEKLEIEKQAYEKVIRMMAHEVNNSIGPINSILDSLTNYQPHIPKEEQASYLEVLQIAIDRNQKLNQFMRNFAEVVRLPEPMRELVSLNEMLRRMVRLMAPEAAEREIRFHLDLPEEAVRRQVDPRQLEQVLINVLKNAMDAIVEGGNIELRLSEQPFCLQIIDDGAGISPTQQEQVFSPFFSTKPQGQGIGLTLSREILLNHGFQFSLQTEQIGRTVFMIYE